MASSAAIGTRPLKGELEIVEFSLCTHSFTQNYFHITAGIGFCDVNQPNPEDYYEKNGSICEFKRRDEERSHCCGAKMAI